MRYFQKINKKLNLKAEIQAGDAEELDEQNGRKILALFEKRLRKNQELRIKHAKKPEKFMKSEIELHDMIQGISKDATRTKFLERLSPNFQFFWLLEVFH